MNAIKKYIPYCGCDCSACVMFLNRRVAVTVVKIHNNAMLVGRVGDSNALLRFRFFRPLDRRIVVPGCIITVLKCEFSMSTKCINCHEVEDDIYRINHRVSFLMDYETRNACP